MTTNTIYLVTIWIIPVSLPSPFMKPPTASSRIFWGDDTAWRQGRVSFNPLKHIDPFGTILLPGLYCCCAVPGEGALMSLPRRHQGPLQPAAIGRERVAARSFERQPL